MLQFLLALLRDTLKDELNEHHKRRHAAVYVLYFRVFFAFVCESGDTAVKVRNEDMHSSVGSSSPSMVVFGLLGDTSKEDQQQRRAVKGRHLVVDTFKEDLKRRHANNVLAAIEARSGQKQQTNNFIFLRQAMNQARRSQDLMMSQIENQPGGFNALRRLYTVRCHFFVFFCIWRWQGYAINFLATGADFFVLSLHS